MRRRVPRSDRMDRSKMQRHGLDSVSQPPGYWSLGDRTASGLIAGLSSPAVPPSSEKGKTNSRAALAQVSC
jgi:hypothetical protein